MQIGKGRKNLELQPVGGGAGEGGGGAIGDEQDKYNISQKKP